MKDSKFIELTGNESGQPVYVSLDHVMMVRDSGLYRIVHFNNGGEILVKESSETLNKLLDAVNLDPYGRTSSV